ncbi:hypothetical protein J6590_006413 [Homalodisca vitripennis]|nr:hypothetical protein J6590_006413 [Homalodisca vitripennis]
MYAKKAPAGGRPDGLLHLSQNKSKMETGMPTRSRYCPPSIDLISASHTPTWNLAILEGSSSVGSFSSFTNLMGFTGYSLDGT